ncbi:MAG TPA: PKD domain-containing protein, partial [Bacteroidales bacterium]|nr:PKD domain-containing protein [Bacteroidales bacterium]
MKKFIFTLFAFLYCLWIFAQTSSPELDYAHNKLNERGEFYFKFKCNDIELVNELSSKLSIDNFKNGFVYAYANQTEFETFLTYNLSFEPVYDYYETPKALTMATTVAQMANWDRYPTHAVFSQMMQNFVTNYPNLCVLENFGTSINGYPLVTLIISNNVNTPSDKPEFWWSSTMHGDELTGYVLLLRFADYLLSNYGTDERVTNMLNNIKIHITPLANPDGTFYNSSNGTSVSYSRRANANNVDLNRNFPRVDGGTNNPIQNETQLTMDYANNHNIVMAANIHGGTECMNYPWDSWTSSQNPHADQNWYYYISTVYVNEVRAVSPSSYFDGPESYNTTGITHGGDWYVITGSRQDYFNYFKHIKELTVEISDNKQLDVEYLNAYWNYNKNAFLSFTEQVLYGFRGIVTDACTGNALDGVKVEIAGHDTYNSFVYSFAPIGNYHRPIYEGDYEVTFSKTGYVSKTLPVSVLNNQSTRLDVQLVPVNVAVPDFSTANTTIGIGSAISFQDLTSGGTVTSRNWYFEGATPSTSSALNPTNITYNSTGNFDVKLEIVSNGCTIEELKSDYIKVIIPGAPTALFTAQETSSCTGEIQFTNQSEGVGNSYLWNFGDGTSSTEENPLHVYTQNGNFTVSLLVTNSVSDDSYTLPETITINRPEAPQITNANRCGTGSVNLSASGSGVLNWYDSEISGNLIHTGNTYTTPALSSTTTYYVQDNIGIEQNVGPNVGGSAKNVAAILYFDVYQPMTLISVDARAGGFTGGTKTIKLLDAENNELYSESVYVGTSTTTLTLNWEIQPGNGYQLTTQTNSNLYRISTANYPYTIDGLVSITGCNQGSSYYYSWFNWKVKGEDCISPRVPVTATINPVPSVNLGADQSQCGGSVTLNAGSGFDSYSWNGSTGTQTLVVNTTGNYSVVVENEFGCTASDNVNVTINQVPQLNLTAIDESAPNANDGSVTANVSGGATPYTYNWTGSSGTGSQITGLGDGTYCVTVTDGNGCSVDDCATIVTLSPTPIANFEANQTSACGGITVQFTNNSQYATSYLWNFGDGTNSTEQNPTHTYSTPGNYTVSLTATNSEGSDTETKTNYIKVFANPTLALTTTPETVDVTNNGSVTADVNGGAIPYNYSWSNSGTGSQITGLSAGTYCVTITDNNGCSVDDCAIVELDGVAPVANFEANQTSACGSLVVQFTDNSLYSPTSWLWNFGDGTNSTEQNPTHTYSTPGNYTVSLTASNSSGNNTLTKDNYIHIYSIPNLEIEITNASGELENDGSAHVIVTGGTTPYSYLWSNDATTSTISNLVPGAYCVTVTTNDNCIATACGNVEVQNGNSPIANFTADNTQNCGSLTVNFTDLSTNNPQEWLWNFGDGTSSTEQNPQHFYSEAGEYTVSLTCSNEQGNDVIVKENYIIVFEKPSLSFEVTDESSTGSADGTITLTITGGTEPYQINWSNNSHGLYLENLSAGLYSVAVIDANNCMNTATVTVGVVTGIANNIKNNISIYPNPSNGNFKIEA